MFLPIASSFGIHPVCINIILINISVVKPISIAKLVIEQESIEVLFVYFFYSFVTKIPQHMTLIICKQSKKIRGKCTMST